jgi:hypothetical protein
MSVNKMISCHTIIFLFLDKMLYFMSFFIEDKYDLSPVLGLLPYMVIFLGFLSINFMSEKVLENY